MSVYGFIHGDVRKLLAPIDGNNQFCGVKNGDGKNDDLRDYPYLYIGNLKKAVVAGVSSGYKFKDAFESGVCMKTCPKDYKGHIGADCLKTSQLC